MDLADVCFVFRNVRADNVIGVGGSSPDGCGRWTMYDGIALSSDLEGVNLLGVRVPFCPLERLPVDENVEGRSKLERVLPNRMERCRDRSRLYYFSPDMFSGRRTIPPK